MKSLLTFRNIALATVACGLVGGAVVAQTQPLPAVQWDNRRLDTLDRNVRRLERALTQRNSQGQPVLVEPDPEVVALQDRVGQMDRRLADLEATVLRVNGDLERMTFSQDEGDRDNAALRTRLADAETRVQALERAATEARAAEEAEAAGPRSPTGDAVADLAAARALSATDPARGRAALEAVTANWPDTAQGREALWRVGDLIRAGGDQAGAVQQYAQALQGWPTQTWAGEVTLKLARGLEATNRDPQACAALGEYTRRYAATSTPALRQIATDTGRAANCT
ncbi:tol-pal system protein [Brevundimonas sp. LM2]|uniref:tetratricopeptide repeat protein n=1 Tax=Brevundimonas sp. LM2 TaxID=1938605 RepID=UPI000983D443|nr:tol-pal system protein [Brevundimonas sp. LM2]AQR60983.1 tol-pal system protein [Brevundimonas sp. LM2]